MGNTRGSGRNSHIGVSLEGFFDYAKERYRIKLRREEGTPPPWTEDPILQEYRFCHIFREDDKTTQWFRRYLRDPLAEDPIKVIKATIGFRWFNRIETGQRIVSILFENGWNAQRVRWALRGVSPIVTGAYLIKTPAGMNKLEGIIWCMKQLKGLARLQGESLEEAHQILMTFPYLGAFMAYEIVTDLRYTCVLRGAADIYSWANPGPGAARGLAHIFGTKLNRHSQRGVAIMITQMRALLAYSHQGVYNVMDETIHRERYWPEEWPLWDMRTVEHTLCEYDKYVRCLLGGRSKRRYVYAGD